VEWTTAKIGIAPESRLLKAAQNFPGVAMTGLQ